MKIKNSLLFSLSFFFVIVLLFGSCKKDVDPLDSLPESFTKKVLIEEFTGEWCPACATAFPRIQTVLDENPNTVFAAALHISDPFSSSENSEIKSTFGISSFPGAMVDRFSFGTNTPRVSVSTSRLREKSETRLTEKVDVGIKLETEILENDKATVKVSIGQNKIISGEMRLTVYLLEDEVAEVNQQGNAPADFKHHAVVREILSETKGTPITKLDATERDFTTLTFNDIDLSEFDQSHLSVIAFVHYFDESDKSKHEILNVQKVQL